MAQVNGIVSSSGDATGSGFTSSRERMGVYKVLFTSGTFNSTPAIVATPSTEEGYVCASSVYDVSYSGFTMNIQNMRGNFTDFGFSFIAASV